MPNLVYDNGALWETKADPQAVPAGESSTGYTRAADLNSARQWVSDIKDAIRAREYHALSYSSVGDGVADDRAALHALANTTIPAAGGELVLSSGTYLVGSALTIPSHVRLTIEAGARLSIASGVTVTINGDFAAPNLRVFSGAGSVAGLKLTRPEWFGAARDGATDDATAFTSAKAALATGGTLQLSLGTYRLNSSFALDKKMTLAGVQGDDAGNCKLSFVLASGTAGLYVTADNVSIRDVYVAGNSDTVRNGVHLQGSGSDYVVYARLQNVWMVGWAVGFRSDTAYMTSLMDCVAASCSAEGFYVSGGATTTVMLRCWALSCTSHGFRWVSTQYCTATCCASDNNGGNGYRVENSNGLVLLACGAEVNAKEAFYSSNSGVSVDGSTCVRNAATSSTSASLAYVVNGGSFSLRNVTEYSIHASYPGTYSCIYEGSVQVQHVANRIQRSVFVGTNAHIVGAEAVWLTGDAPTYVSSTSLTVAGDQTAKYPAGTWVRATITDGSGARKVFSSVTSAVYNGSTLTTLTLLNAVLDGTLSALEYSPAGYQATWTGTRLRVRHDSAAPTAGAWLRGDRTEQSLPAAGSPKGWRCTSDGTPGTWVSEGNL